jgi:hypothetical protein
VSGARVSAQPRPSTGLHRSACLVEASQICMPARASLPERASTLATEQPTLQKKHVGRVRLHLVQQQAASIAPVQPFRWAVGVAPAGHTEGQGSCRGRSTRGRVGTSVAAEEHTRGNRRPGLLAQPAAYPAHLSARMLYVTQRTFGLTAGPPGSLENTRPVAAICRLAAEPVSAQPMCVGGLFESCV